MVIKCVKQNLSKEDFKKIAKVSSELENLNLVIDDNPILNNSISLGQEQED